MQWRYFVPLFTTEPVHSYRGRTTSREVPPGREDPQSVRGAQPRLPPPRRSKSTLSSTNRSPPGSPSFAFHSAVIFTLGHGKQPTIPYRTYPPVHSGIGFPTQRATFSNLRGRSTHTHTQSTHGMFRKPSAHLRLPFH